ncbi:MAG: hypothetical protein A2528_01935 [Candidatus Staskawiczbacteria bacterium RIFOXYD2_FULL_37_9]|uniref:Uncharacterized protein n=1 Tax=Candidatus Staskawiczbacteria bacterium RIFOXYB1_FULL_37_44 TaxID=1802223 RepID=A0A1G2IUI8_9BACT|nr:MAG: hypothetical protein A2358_01720 [Candidatus Staskawiczbacteria bacterium RIFOXYB1_FULL_37_44]OGZ84583.1 MAG: hypothetical protein A2416_01695 [Candidatus Staskawiczbacteria bacterium RIFOXYC1_FULL_37_52]OGZ87629.1 MAG: hypothetical protein A2444_03715 [Candidatus Staskawiczbacteria bacterium RIFOXYC2_FULL_37_19]OGZ89831.1 MAG: hypothetical protein A2581_03935 [Candidatus Staskawiczbacteria bacterium RIFOXYD1_FULL_37_110]OGZ93932.1 MAG: hypothetical protein A2528_01935 [Candidatus Stask
MPKFLSHDRLPREKSSFCSFGLADQEWSFFLANFQNSSSVSLRGAKRRSNPEYAHKPLDCHAPLRRGSQ